MHTCVIGVKVQTIKNTDLNYRVSILVITSLYPTYLIGHILVAVAPSPLALPVLPEEVEKNGRANTYSEETHENSQVNEWSILGKEEK